MAYEAISIVASILIILGYLPEFYTLYKIKKVEMENAYIWIIWTIGSFLALLYGILNEQYYLIATQITVFLMNIITLLCKVYCMYCYKLFNEISKEKIKLSNSDSEYDIGINSNIVIDTDIDNNII
jgi:uncharacterized protein with PQ loop repeat